jgi:hypothetical protein
MGEMLRGGLQAVFEDGSTHALLDPGLKKSRSAIKARRPRSIPSAPMAGGRRPAHEEER